MGDESFDGGVRVPPTLSLGVAACEGIPRASWFSKRVILRNTVGVDVGVGLSKVLIPIFFLKLEVGHLEMILWRF